MKEPLKDLLAQIDIHRKNMAELVEHGASRYDASPRMLREHAEISVLLYTAGEFQTRRIVNLTRWLCG